MQDAGANHFTFHLEATDDVPGCIRKIREAGMMVSLYCLVITQAGVTIRNLSWYDGKS